MIDQLNIALLREAADETTNSVHATVIRLAADELALKYATVDEVLVSRVLEIVSEHLNIETGYAKNIVTQILNDKTNTAHVCLHTITHSVFNEANQCWDVMCDVCLVKIDTFLVLEFDPVEPEVISES